MSAEASFEDPQMELIIHKSQTIQSWVSALKYLFLIHRCLLQIGQKFALKLTDMKPERVFPSLKPSNSEDFRKKLEIKNINIKKSPHLTFLKAIPDL